MIDFISAMILKVLGAGTALAQVGGPNPSGGLPQPSGGNFPGGQITLSNPLGSQSFADLVVKIWGALFTLSIPIVSIMVLVGGYYILTAAGNEENLRKGRQTITYAVIGFAVILVSGGIVTLIRSLFSL